MNPMSTLLPRAPRANAAPRRFALLAAGIAVAMASVPALSVAAPFAVIEIGGGRHWHHHRHPVAGYYYARPAYVAPAPTGRWVEVRDRYGRPHLVWQTYSAPVYPGVTIGPGYEPGYGSGYGPGYTPGYGPGYAPGYAPGAVVVPSGPVTYPSGQPGWPSAPGAW